VREIQHPKPPVASKKRGRVQPGREKVDIPEVEVSSEDSDEPAESEEEEEDERPPPKKRAKCSIARDPIAQEEE
jgi:hypothetical protein